MKAINIILDESKQESGESPDVLFVEIETDEGCSIGIGERIIRDDGLVSIRITAIDIEQG